MHMEEERFFPVAEICFRTEDWLCVQDDLKIGRDTAILIEVEEEFGALGERLLE
jgi:hypothetical protein